MTDINPQIEDSLQISNRIFKKVHKTPHIYIHHSKTVENKFKNISKESIEKRNSTIMKQQKMDIWSLDRNNKNLEDSSLTALKYPKKIIGSL